MYSVIYEFESIGKDFVVVLHEFEAELDAVEYAYLLCRVYDLEKASNDSNMYICEG